jgi:bleomycin hydrolase
MENTTMKRTFTLMVLVCFILAVGTVSADRPAKDKGKMIDYKNPFWEKIKESTEKFDKKDKDKKLSYKIDFDDWDLPKSTDEFTTAWHNAPVTQGWTGTCWCFCGTSYLESEIYRLSKEKIKISELFTVYWEYVDKARRFIEERGNSHFSEGSQANAVIRIWEQYGCVPLADYTGLINGREFHAHGKMVKEMTNFLNHLKKSNDWNVETGLATIKSILNNYIGTPPETITFKGKNMTPKEFYKNVTKIKADDYVDIMSLLEKPYMQTAEYEVPDNWWHFDKYYNVDLDTYMSVIKKAVKAGQTLVIGGDVSEAGYFSHSDAAVIPTFDIPSDYIDENARQFRFSNKTTTDDHGIHLVGYTEKDGDTWFLIKDSGSGARNGKNSGYYFYHEDYIKLKIMNYTVHKSIVNDLLKKFK